ncbi:MAG: hypothetical protein SGARI_004141 [Bacillariaceae sp.]
MKMRLDVMPNPSIKPSKGHLMRLLITILPISIECRSEIKSIKQSMKSGITKSSAIAGELIERIEDIEQGVGELKSQGHEPFVDQLQDSAWPQLMQQGNDDDSVDLAAPFGPFEGDESDNDRNAQSFEQPSVGGGGGEEDEDNQTNGDNARERERQIIAQARDTLELVHVHNVIWASLKNGSTIKPTGLDFTQALGKEQKFLDSVRAVALDPSQQALSFKFEKHTDPPVRGRQEGREMSETWCIELGKRKEDVAALTSILKRSKGKGNIESFKSYFVKNNMGFGNKGKGAWAHPSFIPGDYNAQVNNEQWK